MYQYDSIGRIFVKIHYVRFSIKFAYKFQFGLKSDGNMTVQVMEDEEKQVHNVEYFKYLDSLIRSMEDVLVKIDPGFPWQLLY